MTKRLAPLCLVLLAVSVRAAAQPAQPEPPAVAGEAQTIAARTRTAAHHTKDAPTVVVHVPPGFDPRPPLHLVVFLHGYSGCALMLAEAGRVRCKPVLANDPLREGWNLAGHHD